MDQNRLEKKRGRLRGFRGTEKESGVSRKRTAQKR